MSFDEPFEATRIIGIRYRGRKNILKDRRGYQTVGDRAQLSVLVDAGRYAMQRRRPVNVVLHVFFAGPYDLNGSCNRFGNQLGLQRKIRYKSSPKAAAEARAPHPNVF